MEIRTAKRPLEPEEAEIVPPPDRARYLRAQQPQTVRRAHRLSRLIATALKLAARTAVILGAAALGATLVYHAFTSGHFALKAITIRGCTHADPQRLERMVRASFPPSILRIDLGQLQERLEQENWILRADVRRILPSSLLIEIEERRPTALLELHDELVLADDDGVLLDRYDAKYGKLDVPVFRGFWGATPEEYKQHAEENAARVRLGRRLMQELEEGSEVYSRNISEVDLSDPQNVRLLLVDDTAEIFMGDRDFLKRFQTLLNNMKQYQELKSRYGAFASVDLRYDGQIIYRPRYPDDGQPVETVVQPQR